MHYLIVGVKCLVEIQIAQDSSFEDITSQNEKWKSYINREVTLTTLQCILKR